MLSDKSAATIEWQGWTYEVRGDVLVASRAGFELMWLPLAPVLEGNSTTVTNWAQSEPEHLVGTLDVGGSVHLSTSSGHLCYWMETDVKQFGALTYFPGGTFKGRHWQTYMSDQHDRRWDVDIDQEVGISSAYDGDNPFGADGEGMTDPGDYPPYWVWNVPVRAFSVHTNAGWVGFSMPGPLPVGLTRLRMNEGRLSISFDVLRPSCTQRMTPRVYLVTGLSEPYDLLDEHRIISDNLGLTVEKDLGHPSWWTNPDFKYWDEYMRLAHMDPEAAAEKTVMTGDLWLDWLKKVKESIGIAEINCGMEQGCYNYYGDYRPTDAMGGVDGVREMVDRLRKEGTHVGYYIHPYRVNTKVDFWKEHPEAFCKPRDASRESFYSLEFDKDKPVIKFLDWTHPLAREFIAEQIRFMLSDAPGCLNCDIIRSNNWTTPAPKLYEFHDPDWGIGDLMTYRVQRFIYESAKRVKPDCMVSKVSAVDPYMQPCADVVYLCEEWNGYTDNWYRRGRIATRAMPGSIFLTDAHFVTLTKGYEYYMGMLAWNYPQTFSAEHAPHPYTHYRELKDKDYRRRKAGFHAAINAPLRVGDVSRVNIHEDGEVEQWRKRTSGPLNGFFAAIGIGKRTLVTYSETEARIATSISRTVEFPLPPRAKLESIEMVAHEGEPEPWQYVEVKTDDGPGLRIHVEDCGNRPLYYRVRYKLTKEV